MVTEGSTVEVHYTGKLSNGDKFDSSNGREPLKFTIGANQVIRGFENAVLGKTVGEKVTVDIPSDDAYGPVREEYTQKVQRALLPKEVKIGDQLEAMTKGGNIPVLVTELTDEYGVVDANHPLAGQNLIFDIEIVSIS